MIFDAIEATFSSVMSLCFRPHWKCSQASADTACKLASLMAADVTKIKTLCFRICSRDVICHPDNVSHDDALEVASEHLVLARDQWPTECLGFDPVKNFCV